MADFTIDRCHIGYFGRLSKRTWKPTIIVIHHSDTKDDGTTRRVLKNKGCSTHFEIEKDGHIYQYADLYEICLHCSGVNHRAIGIDITHRHGTTFTDAQVQACKWLCKHICNQTGIPCKVRLELEPGIYPHCGIGLTVCPDGFPIAKVGEPEISTLDAIRALIDLAKMEGEWDEICHELIKEIT